MLVYFDSNLILTRREARAALAIAVHRTVPAMENLLEIGAERRLQAAMDDGR